MKATTLNDKEYPVSSGEVLTLSCTDGFQLKGSTTLTCQNEGYYFHDESEDEPRCIPSEQSGITFYHNYFLRVSGCIVMCIL